MKPIFTYFPHITHDLTEAKVHVVDGQVIVYFPVKWEVFGEIEVTHATEGPVTLKQYIVTEWGSKVIE